MKETLTLPVEIPEAARRKTKISTQEIKQNASVVDFFGDSPDRKVHNNNYIGNPFPGNAYHRVFGLTFSLVNQYIEDDAANNIDARAIVNALKDAGIIFTKGDQYDEQLRSAFANHFNFEDTHLETQLSVAGDPAAGGAAEVTEVNTAIVQAGGLYRLPNWFDLAPQEVFNLSVTFADSSVFPSDADWEASGQAPLKMAAMIYLAEIDIATFETLNIKNL